MYFFIQCDAVKWIKNFFVIKNINAARQKLERLPQEEVQAVGAQTLRLVAGEPTHSARYRHLLNTLLSQGNKATLGMFNIVVGDNGLVLCLTKC
jgi:hypothetical protein